jgi:nucleoside-diphosphate-sugar epimerase
MPVIVIGADTPTGNAIAHALASRAGETRAFVSDPATADPLRDLGIKVAIGDVTDGSHVGGAAIGSFVAVVVAEAANDERERSFAPTPGATTTVWGACLAEAGVHRVLWVAGQEDPETPPEFAAQFPEFARVSTADRSAEEVAREVAYLDDLATLDGA